MSQKKMTFSQKFQKAKSSGSFSAVTYAGTGSIFSLPVFYLSVYLDFPLCSNVIQWFQSSTFTGWKNFERMLNDKVF